MKKIKKSQFTTIIWILFYILVFALFLKHSYAYLDPDLGWHLKTGEEIIRTGQLPSINSVDYTLLGKPWVDHEWLSNALIYWVFINWGYLTLNIIFALIPILTLLLLNRFIIKEYTKEKTNIWLFILLETIGLIALIPHCGVRLQEITILCILLLSLILYHYNQNKDWKLLLWLLPLLYFWANTHGGFLIAWAILGLFGLAKATEYLFSRFLPKKFMDFSQVLTPPQIRNYSLLAILGLATTFITPYGLKLYEFFGTYTNTFYFDHILEWLPQWDYPYVYWQCLYICLIISALAIEFYYISKKNSQKKFNLWQIGIIIGFVILAMKSRRHFPLLFIIATPWLLAFITELLGIKAFKFEYFKNRAANNLINIFLLLCLLIVPLNIFISTNYVSDPFNSFCEDKYSPDGKSFLFPCQAAKVLQSNPEYKNLKLFNNFGWGGFLIWAWPEKQLFIDGRMPQANYENRSILEEYWDFFNKDQTEYYLNKHGIQAILLSDDSRLVTFNWFEKNFLFMDESQFNNQTNHLKEYLDNNSAWKLIYTDAIAKVYIKTITY